MPSSCSLQHHFQNCIRDPLPWSTTKPTLLLAPHHGFRMPNMLKYWASWGEPWVTLLLQSLCSIGNITCREMRVRMFRNTCSVEICYTLAQLQIWGMKGDSGWGRKILFLHSIGNKKLMALLSFPPFSFLSSPLTRDSVTMGFFLFSQMQAQLKFQILSAHFQARLLPKPYSLAQVVNNK